MPLRSYEAASAAAFKQHSKGSGKIDPGTPAFSTAFAQCEMLGYILCANTTFSGSATGSRYAVSNGGVINSNGGGTSLLPGSSAGTGTNFGASPYGLYV